MTLNRFESDESSETMVGIVFGGPLCSFSGSTGIGRF